MANVPARRPKMLDLPIHRSISACGCRRAARRTGRTLEQPRGGVLAQRSGVCRANSVARIAALLPGNCRVFRARKFLMTREDGWASGSLPRTYDRSCLSLATGREDRDRIHWRSPSSHPAHRAGCRDRHNLWLGIRAQHGIGLRVLGDGSPQRARHGLVLAAT